MKILEVIDMNLLKAFTGGLPDSDTASKDDAGTSKSDDQGNKVVVVGDSLAVGTGSQIPNAIVDAKVGINSSAILSKAQNDKQLQGADVAIISAGANDGAGTNGKNPNSQKTIANFLLYLTYKHFRELVIL